MITALPYYNEINEFLETLPHAGKTSNPLFYCLRLHQLEEGVTIYRPPFRRSFYFFALFVNAKNIQIKYDDKVVNNPDSYMVCHSPGLVYSFSHDATLEGYIVYFKPECFSFFRPDFHSEFPFFHPLHTNLYTMDQSAAFKLAPHFEEVLKAYHTNPRDLHMEARTRLLSLFYHLKEFVSEWCAGNRFVTPQQMLLSRYIQLVNNHYIDKRTVKEYADLLAVTPNHLSQTVKLVTGKNALSFISERLLTESKSLILYTDFDISEIAYQLNFSDPANFGKFFRKATGVSPMEFRKKGTQ
ncbi:MAG: helix-turn-helix domain-containing protein [Ilyomonas sp.]